MSATMAIVLVGIATSMIVQASGIDRRLSNAIYDAWLQGRPMGQVSSDVVLVGISTEDVRRLQKPFPWPRSEQSVVFEKIADRHPSVVAIDLIYAEPSAEADQDLMLAKQIRRCGQVVAAAYFAEHGDPSLDPQSLLSRSGNAMGAQVSTSGWTEHRAPVLPTPAIASAVTRIGHVHVSEDSDGVFRRVPLIIRDADRFYPSLSLQSVLLHLKVDWSHVRLQPGELSIVNIPGRETIRIPLDESGRMLLKYPQHPEEAFEGVDVWRLVAQGEAPEMAGRIVVVGAMITGHGDMYATPVQSLTPGLLIQAATIQAILHGEFLIEAPWWTTSVTAAFLSLLIGGVMYFFRPIPAIAAFVLVGAATVYASLHLLESVGYWITPIVPLSSALVVLVGMFLLHLSDSERHRRDLARLFGRYVDRSLIDQMLKQPDIYTRQSLGTPRRKEVTVFFSDLRGFVSSSTHLEPEDLFSILNRYFERMIHIARTHQGTVNKLMGDGMLVFFNDPVEFPDHALRCLRMATAMQLEVKRLNEELERSSLPTLAVAMGINTGYVTVGNMGSDEYTDYTVIGPTVNLAARLTEIAPPASIWTLDRTRCLCDQEFRFRSVGPVSVKGCDQPLEVFQVEVLASD